MLTDAGQTGGSGSHGPALSLVAELLLFALDPDAGGLLPRRRRRFRTALVRAYRAERPGRGWPGIAVVARRRAAQELAQAGLVQSRSLASIRLCLADRPAAMRRFRRLCGALLDDDPPAARELSLVLLLAWSGILPKRMTRDERRIAARRLRRLAREPLLTATLQAPLSGASQDPEWIYGLGRVAYEAQEDFAVDVISDFASGGLDGIDFGHPGPGGVDGGASSGGGDGGGGGSGNYTLSAQESSSTATVNPSPCS